MSQEDTKLLHLDIKDLSFKSEQHVADLIRYLSESLPQIQLSQNGLEIEVITPEKFSKRALKLRIKKFLHKKGLSNDYRAISLIDVEKEGYVIKEKKVLELTYY
jgi:hypothetical protein